MKKREHPLPSPDTQKTSVSPESIREHKVIMASADLREGWDLESWSEQFVAWVRQQPWYRPDFLYSGFDARDVGKKNASTWEGGIVWASSEGELLGSERANNPMSYAQDYEKPAIAVYDPAKMQEKSVRAYVPMDASARIAIVKIRLE